MLHQALLAAVHHGVVLLMLQQHSHHRGLGYDGVDAVLQPPVLRQGQYIVPEARPIVGPDRTDAPLYRRRGKYPGPHCQIAALGVSAQPQLQPGTQPRHFLCVRHRLFLRRDLCHAAQVKILLPARQRIVCSPEGKIGRSVSAEDGQRRELLRPLRVQMLPVATQLHIPEPRRFRHAP